MWAQVKYNPFLVGAEAVFPTQRWGNHQGSFPNAGYAMPAPAFHVSKSYYKSGRHWGWFFFGKVIWWQLRRGVFLERLSTLAGAPALSSLKGGSPHSMVAGIGTAIRWFRSRWQVILPVDLHIMSLSYPTYEGRLSDGSEISIRLHMNTFLGVGISGRVHYDLPILRRWSPSLSIGGYFPMLWGMPTKLIVREVESDGEVRVSERRYYLIPTYWGVQTSLSLVL
ncbi:MAG: hypothetical protein RMJ66_03005 [Bacteroidia bacterium]|nr:hypothetical protein [Bacteroidia bacterium]